MPVKEAKDVRKEYANKLRAFADFIEQNPNQPKGCRIHIFWDDPMQSVTHLQKDEMGINSFAIAGALLSSALDTLMTKKINGIPPKI